MMRLVLFEIRKLGDTKSSAVLLAVCVLASAGFSIIGLVARAEEGVVVISEIGAAGVLPFAVISPILGILAAAGDWSSGAIQETFVLEPRRLRVFAAKWCAALIVALGACAGAVICAIGIGLIVAGIRGESIVAGDISSMIRGVSAIVIPTASLGFGLGAVLLSTPLAIVVVLVVELIGDAALTALPHALGTFFQTSALQNWLSSGAGFWEAVTSAALWYVLPLVIGATRYKRKEVTT
jgi:ABC-2 type transport system permease protein